MNRYILIIVFLVGSLSLFSQANIKLNTSDAVDQLMDRFVTYGKANETVKAWRIQIITTDDRREMESTMTSFKYTYPYVNIDWRHVAPYYQVRVGFYETKNKMMPFLLELKKTYPSATPVYDAISKRTLVN